MRLICCKIDFNNLQHYKRKKKSKLQANVYLINKTSCILLQFNHIISIVDQSKNQIFNISRFLLNLQFYNKFESALIVRAQLEKLMQTNKIQFYCKIFNVLPQQFIFTCIIQYIRNVNRNTFRNIFLLNHEGGKFQINFAYKQNTNVFFFISSYSMGSNKLNESSRHVF